jgi:hypothetical protein
MANIQYAAVLYGNWNLKLHALQKVLGLSAN